MSQWGLIVPLLTNSVAEAMPLLDYDSSDPVNSAALAFHAARTVLMAGIWLNRHGLGRLRFLPYFSANNHWRCEFAAEADPQVVAYRYSDAYGLSYLEGHPWNPISPATTARGLGEAILQNMSTWHQAASRGERDAEYGQWLERLEAALQQGLVPYAFGQFGTEERGWSLTEFGRHGVRGHLAPYPGYDEKRWTGADELFDEARAGEERWRRLTQHRATFSLPSTLLDNRVTNERLVFALRTQLLASKDFDATALLQSLLGQLAMASPEPQMHLCIVHDGPVSPKDARSKSPVVRRARRLVDMVHELHKVGYQLLRIAPGINARTGGWMGQLVHARDVAEDGWTPLRRDPRLLYCTDEEKAFFGWADCEKDDARALANKFVDRFPEFAAECRGDDEAYAGWLSGALGRAEHEWLPTFFDAKHDPVPGELPPIPIPLGRPGDAATLRKREALLLPHHALRLDDIPDPDAPLETLEAFAIRHDGYHGGLLDGEAAVAVVRQFEATRGEDMGIDGLRTVIYECQRVLRSDIQVQEITPMHPMLLTMRAAVATLRGRLRR